MIRDRAVARILEILRLEVLAPTPPSQRKFYANTKRGSLSHDLGSVQHQSNNGLFCRTCVRWRQQPFLGATNEISWHGMVRTFCHHPGISKLVAEWDLSLYMEKRNFTIWNWEFSNTSFSIKLSHTNDYHSVSHTRIPSCTYTTIFFLTYIVILSYIIIILSYKSIMCV